MNLATLRTADHDTLTFTFTKANTEHHTVILKIENSAFRCNLWLKMDDLIQLNAALTIFIEALQKDS